MPGLDVKIAPDGEILGRGPNIARGYFKKPDATAEVFLPDGWFATGDIGRIDEDGFLYITDRKKDLIVTAGGINIAPQNIENLLKADPFISQVHGARRQAAVSGGADHREPGGAHRLHQGRGHPAHRPRGALQASAVVGRVSQHRGGAERRAPVVRADQEVPVVPNDFTVDNGLLTPTLKVKRKVIAEQYRGMLDALYR